MKAISSHVFVKSCFFLGVRWLSSCYTEDVHLKAENEGFLSLDMLGYHSLLCPKPGLLCCFLHINQCYTEHLLYILNEIRCKAVTIYCISRQKGLSEICMEEDVV